MLYILPKILTLIHYNQQLKENPEECRPEYCACCGKARPWRHGQYSRKPDRSSELDDSLNPIFIQRYYCPECGGTTSVLPECMSPRRWYLWEIQQAVLILSILGKSAYAIAAEVIPSRHTITRWLTRFHEKFRLHKDTLCTRIIELGRTFGFSEFWTDCFKQLTLGAAMQLCHVSEIFIP